MLANLLLSVNVVVPLFLEMLLGFFLRRVNLLDEPTSKALNRLIFKCFLPTLLFYNIYTTNIAEISGLFYMLFTVAGIFLIFLVGMLVIPLFEKDKRKCPVIIQACFRSNYVLFGVPLGVLLLGDNNIGKVTLLVAVAVPMFNMLAVVVLESFRGQNVKILTVLKGILTNPLIIASILGLLVNFSGIRFMSCVTTTISQISKIATPLALIVLGSEFRFEAVKEYRKQLLAGLSLRLVIIPVLAILLAAALGIRGEEFVAIMIVFASPIAVSSYTMAEIMDADGTLASQLVFYSTALSIVTLFIFIFLTKTAGLF